MGLWTGIGYRVVEHRVRYTVEADNAKEARRKLWDRVTVGEERLSDVEQESEFYTLSDVRQAEEE